MEIRKDLWNRHCVLISSERAKRPSDLGDLSLSSSQLCPFCEGNESQTPGEVFALRPDESLPNAPGWSIRVVPNKYPALSQISLAQIPLEKDSMDMCIHCEDTNNNPLENSFPGNGIHWVVVETNQHAQEYTQMETAHIQEIFQIYRQGFSILWNHPKIQSSLLFKNHGNLAGASLSHPHSQMIGMPMIPRVLREKMDAFQNHYSQKSCCLLCFILSQEKEMRARLICENDSFCAVLPYAPRSPFEITLIPKNHTPHFHQISSGEIADLASIWKEIFLRLQKILGDFSYNYLIHTSPKINIPNSFQHFHYHFEIIPRLAYLAGFEWGTGFYINSVFPEDAAQKLRDAL
jgi:UDPglucose--hexose-1-phosphate uridylyltransferase